MTFGIVEENGYISSVEKRFSTLEEAKGNVPEGYWSALVQLPENAVAGAYYVGGTLSNRPAGKERKKRV